MSPPRVPEIKQAVRAVDAAAAETLARELLDAESVSGRARTTGGSGMSPRVVLDGLTYFRILSVPVVMALILAGPERDSAYTAAAVLFALSASTDFLDGFLARRWEKTTTLGSFLDTTADKLLVSGRADRARRGRPRLGVDRGDHRRAGAA